MNSFNIEYDYKNHVLLRRKGRGDAGTLAGKVVLLLFFVNDSIAIWTDSARKKFSKTHQTAMETIIALAQEHSVSLTIDTVVEEVTVPFACNRDSSHDWPQDIIAPYSKKLFKGYRKHFKETLGYDQIAVAFVLNRDFRAYAHQAPFFDIECSVLSSSASNRTIIHEFFHQFGAEDIYPLEYCMESVKKLNYPSIMAITGNTYVDTLTAYAIGWSDEIDEKAVALLEATKHLTIKEIFNFRKRT